MGPAGAHVEDPGGAMEASTLTRTPEVIMDTRLHDVKHNAVHHCDECALTLYGKYQGAFMEGVRELSMEVLAHRWKHGLVDASWYCTQCWLAHYRRRYPNVSEAEVRNLISLPPPRRPEFLEDRRLAVDKRSRWAYCDRCGTFCSGKTRDFMWGSLVYKTDGGLAGPPNTRSECFPAAGKRYDAYLNGWPADYACRACLPILWKCPPEQVADWLRFQHSASYYVETEARQARYEGPSRSESRQTRNTRHRTRW